MCVGGESIDLVIQTQLADRIGSKRHYSSSDVIFVTSSSANYFHSDCHPFDGVETNPT